MGGGVGTLRIGDQIGDFRKSTENINNINVIGGESGIRALFRTVAAFRRRGSGATLGPTNFGYLGLHRTSDLRVSMALLANAVASGSPSRTRPTRSGDNQARWIRLLT